MYWRGRSSKLIIRRLPEGFVTIFVTIFVAFFVAFFVTVRVSCVRELTQFARYGTDAV